ncbi:hypothetical protein [Pelagibacterium lentulum]|uniref:ABM domain-containing protein n=1 Tax=Pelagibacterium lentulum TaxID=2029865 RepID=A0A916W2F3_9HYPH|nr:hypothetical protein [Pelagibacterium lentulum]GGA60811.1 hypothetical protein GCM10011499_33830 [Pelagibacterium lentulum]
MQSKVIELVSFSLKPSADPGAFLSDNAAVEAFCRGQEGFVSRRLSRDDNGGWVDCVEWESMEAAQAAAKAIGKAEGVGPWLAAIDMDGLAMRHLTVQAAL